MKKILFITFLLFIYFFGSSAYSQNVGIGTATPGAKLEINGDIKIDGGSPAPGRVLTAVNGSGLAAWQDIPSTPKISFKANLSANQNIPNFADTKINFTAGSFFNDGAGFNNSTNSFVAPSGGLYYFHAAFLISSPTTTFPAVIRINQNGGVLAQMSNAVFQSTSSYTSGIEVSVIAKLNMNEVVYVSALIAPGSTSTINNYQASTFFEGYRIY